MLCSLELQPDLIAPAIYRRSVRLCSSAEERIAAAMIAFASSAKVRFRPARLTTARLFSALVALFALMAARPAWAGYYDVTYSGGTWSTTNASGPYEYMYYGFGYDVSDIGTPTFANCSGTITATLTWVPDFDGDVPPASCIVAENTTVWANWSTQQTSGGYVTPNGTATVH